VFVVHVFKGIVSRDFFCVWLFVKQLLLVPSDILRNNFDFNQITDLKGDSPMYSPQGCLNSPVYSPPGSFDSPVYSPLRSLDSLVYSPPRILDSLVHSSPRSHKFDSPVYSLLGSRDSWVFSTQDTGYNRIPCVFITEE
jgi:hypothetical protein